MPYRKPDISVVTVNYNGWEDTREFISSWVQTVVSVSYEIIVVDNASRTDESNTLKALSPHVSVIRNNQNLGFAAANNIGIQSSQGDYIFFLNNDLVIKEDHLKEQLDRMETQEDLAAISPLIRDYASPHAIQYAGYTPLTRVTMRNRGIGIGEQDASRYPAASTPLLHGAAMLVKRSAILKVGTMPEMYFLYYEELDWSTTFTEKGYRLGYDPTCVVYHKESRSTGADSPLKSYYMSRNRLIFTYRHRAGLIRAMGIIYQICLAFPKSSLCYLARGKTRNVRAIWRGINAFLHINPKTSLI